MRALVTGSRLPFAIEQIRKLGRMGHEVHASDALWSAPGNHSRFSAGHVVTAPPRHEPEQFVRDIVQYLREHPIDRLIPSFEEVFYLARHRRQIEAHTELFAPSYDVLAALHDKSTMVELAQELGVDVAPTLLARDRAELEAACRDFPRFFARPAYTRGGVTLFTNAGPLAGVVRLEDCHPTPENPYLVQPFLDGRDLCTHSIVHHGRVAAHVSYIHPLTLEHAGGIVFESVVVPETLRVTRLVAEATGYHGQISFDFMETEQGIYLVECNPRPTAGLTVMPDAIFDDGMMERTGGETLVGPAGGQRKLSLALLRNMVVHWESLPENLAALASKTPDIYADPDDLVPLFSQLFAYGKVLKYRLANGRADNRGRSDIMQGYFEDLTFDGDGTVPSFRTAARRAA